MRNCLVTKLKGEVQNENLPIFGRQRWEYNVSSESDINIGTVFTGKAYLTGNAYFKDAGGNNIGKSTTTGFSKIHVVSGIVYLDIPYNSVTASYGEFALARGWKVSSSDFKNVFTANSDFYALTLNNGISGNLSDITGFNIRQNFILNNSPIDGQTTDVNYSAQVILKNNPNILGTVEDLLNKLATAFTTVKTTDFQLVLPNASYQGITGVNFFHTVRFNGNGTYDIDPT